MEQKDAKIGMKVRILQNAKPHMFRDRTGEVGEVLAVFTENHPFSVKQGVTVGFKDGLEDYPFSGVELEPAEEKPAILTMIHEADPDLYEHLEKVIAKHFEGKDPMKVVDYLLWLVIEDDAEIQRNLDWATF